MSDYCYCDRLLCQIRDPALQPLAFWFCLLQQNLQAVLSPDKSGFRDEVSFRLCHTFPKDMVTVREPEAEAFHFL
ncbi:MAG: hypothetical protein LLG13_08790 [Bacteroidales bacterium]|nr:hypothetical protein [Bacteroidales bacterium]